MKTARRFAVLGVLTTLFVFMGAGVALASCNEDPANLCLPLWRWNPEIWYDPGGFFGSLGSAVNVPRIVGSAMLGFAGGAWNVLKAAALVVIEGVSSQSVLTAILDNSNLGFQSMRPYIVWAAPLALILGLLSRVIPAAAGSGFGGRFFGALAGLALPLAILWAMSAATAGWSPGAAYPVASPAWFVQKGWEVVDLPTSTIVGNLTAAAGNMQTQASAGTSCGEYIHKLNEYYRVLSVKTNRHGQSIDQSATQRAAMVLAVAKSWEASHLRTYYMIQFGSVDVGERIGCRVLEAQRPTPAAAQARISGSPEIIFATAGENKSHQKFKYISFLFCEDPGDPSPLLAAHLGSGSEAASQCEAWASGEISNIPDDLPGRLGNGKEDRYSEAVAKALVEYPGERERIEREWKAIDLMQGSASGSGDAFTGGIASIIGAGGMMAFLGVPTFMAALSGFVLVFMLMLLPISLVTSAVGMQRLGKGLMTTTIFMVFAKAFFTLIMGIGILFLSLASNLIDAFPS